MAWLFSLNTHTSFYGSYWLQIIWWLLALAMATLQDTKVAAAPAR